jgi:hypothetical protein
MSRQPYEVGSTPGGAAPCEAYTRAAERTDDTGSRSMLLYVCVTAETCRAAK